MEKISEPTSAASPEEKHLEEQDRPIHRIVSGIQPSGKLHLGNYMGAIKNWLDLQNRYECYFFIADWHALSTNYEHTDPLKNNVRDMLLDWLSLGLDPEKCTIFLQSDVLEHAELNLLLGMITPVSWLQRNPTYKDQQEQIHSRDLATYGFLGYPVLMAADILIYRADHVPVGQDQLPHLELTREIARRLHHLYGPCVPEPLPLLTPTPKLLGLDGRKMSKSYDNCIYISDPSPVVWEKIRTMMTDPQRVRRTDPGDPEKCPVFNLHGSFTDEMARVGIDQGCRTAGIGCIDCKKILCQNIEAVLSPARQKRQDLEGEGDRLRSILASGAERARQEAKATLSLVRKAMKLPETHLFG
ncbi:MAG: tryptophan--tRNA ligase [Leptospirales bacterium]